MKPSSLMENKNKSGIMGNPLKKNMVKENNYLIMKTMNGGSENAGFS
jgi:hypothetical protein